MTELVLKSPPRCARCGAPLPAADAHGRVVCMYCKAEYVTHHAPPARGRHDYAAGDAVLVKWGGDFWDAHVVAKVAEKRWKIRYDGYDASSDEVVGPGRIRPRDEADADEDLDDAALHDEDDSLADEAAVTQATAAVRQDSGPFPRGAQVDVLWNGRWYDGTVKRVLASDRWLVGYDGWSESWDEAVSHTRIRARTRKARGVGIAVAVFVLLATVAGGAAAFLSIRQQTFATPAGPASAPVGAPGTPLTDLRGLQPGQPITVEWQGSWYTATVVEVQTANTVRIHYVGWSQNWDETVGIERVRLP